MAGVFCYTVYSQPDKTEKKMTTSYAEFDKIADMFGMQKFVTPKATPKSEVMEKAVEWQAEQNAEDMRYEEMAEVETLRHIAELCPTYEVEF